MEAGFLRQGVVVLLWWSVVVVQGGFSFYKSCFYSDFYQVSIPKSGLYMVMVTVDPKYQESEHLNLAGFKHLAAYGDYGISCMTVALPMNAGRQSVVEWSSSQRENFQGATAVSVVYISDLSEGYFVLVRLKITRSGTPYFHTARSSFSQTLVFYNVMDDSGRWLSAVHSNFNIEQSGIHWVSARPDPGYGTSVDVEIMNGDRVLFTVYSEGGQAISTSGAFYLERNSDVSMKVPKYKRFYQATLLSFAFLPQNGKVNDPSVTTTTMAPKHKHRRRKKKKKKILMYYMAWTAYVDPKSTHTYSRGEKVVFQGIDALTDYGSLYNANLRCIEIKVSGSYLISIRMVPSCRQNPHCGLQGVLYLNGQPKWNAWSEGGVPSGQAVALSLSRGDTLHLEADLDRDVDVGTMMSIAFVAS